MILIKDNQFIDEHNRILLLRGVNLGGSTKVPYTPDGASWNRDGFYNHREVSFVGRPFPLEEADEHFRRLKAWGYTFLRYLITWEAIEHAGPVEYDFEYLEYTRKIIQKAAEYGIQVFIDPHQDVWSRFSGGDGAPGWTLEMIGMDLTKLHQAGAAFLHQESGDPYPRMVWPTNNNKLAAATMFTLFFAGNTFAPNLIMDGQPVQEYLQSHYIQSVLQMANLLKDLPNVVGYDSLNEPSEGYIGQSSLSGCTITPMRLGEMPTFLQGMAAGSGLPQQVDVYKLGLVNFVKDGKRIINPAGVSIWRDGYEDVWKQHGVWDTGPENQPVALKDDYFAIANGKQVNFNRDFFKPFLIRFIDSIRSVDPDAIIFIEEVPHVNDLVWTGEDPQNVVLAGHWYDDMTLVTKSFRSWFTIDAHRMKPVFGKRNVRENFKSQINDLIQHGIDKMGNIPTVVGEIGIPFDLHQKRAHKTGDESEQIAALDTTMYALESNFASFTLWNYTADNTNHRGDKWNDEDLSLFSRDQMKGTGSIHDGGRALQAAIRPYACKVAGKPLEMSFDIHRSIFNFKYIDIPDINMPTELFIPSYQYPDGIRVVLSDGKFEYEPEKQMLVYFPATANSIHTIQITPASK